MQALMDRRTLDDIALAVAPAIRASSEDAIAKANSLIDGALEKATAPLLKRIEELESRAPVNGDPGKDADPELVRQLVEEMVSALPPPKDGDPGKDCDPAEVASLVTAEVQRAISALPVPKDGEDGEDGVGMAGAVIDREGQLVITLTDGSTRELGVVVGKDVDQAEISRRISEEVSKIPPPKEGRDGFGFEDMTEELADDGRTIVRRYTRGDEVKEFRHTMAVILDRGVYRDGKDYAHGDGVSFGGSFWIAQRNTSDKPETSDAWRLAIKRGRDGKNARVLPADPAPPVRLK